MPIVTSMFLIVGACLGVILAYGSLVRVLTIVLASMAILTIILFYIIAVQKALAPRLRMTGRAHMRRNGSDRVAPYAKADEPSGSAASDALTVQRVAPRGAADPSLAAAMADLARSMAELSKELRAHGEEMRVEDVSK